MHFLNLCYYKEVDEHVSDFKSASLERTTRQIDGNICLIASTRQIDGNICLIAYGRNKQKSSNRLQAAQITIYYSQYNTNVRHNIINCKHIISYNKKFEVIKIKNLCKKI